ncbi:MFS transporter [Ureibacillus acetophenoni]|uniref:Predicted MFS family arabinose efflux permease n=1 Tax=Ureibacillus acetophenoni TaxID=614649 RepID=A0A285U9N9_9BACL|nr:MFS transporter [Ureibacillus acetophenoni]SOC38529.1 predicted MFS family arabinose efflux permease [Ureibacillus acetophenoni]
MENQTLKKSVLFVLLITVLVSGISQGLLMPVISIIFEQQGISPTISGLHSAAFYIGILIASPFMEMFIRKFGFKNVILIGLTITIVSNLLFLVFESIFIWFLLRLLIGIGANMCALASQTWITSTVGQKSRGVIISIYGLCFGLGFAIGPYATSLIEYNENLPFLLLACLSMTIFTIVLFLENRHSISYEEQVNFRLLDFFNRFKLVLNYAWVALLFPFTYGVLESVINVNLPTQVLRSNLDLNLIAVLVSVFALGSIIFQIPLGIMSDRYGRRKILAISTAIGTFSFGVGVIFFHNIILLISMLCIAGMFVGSIYSLGIAYMIDLIPKQLIPMGTVLSGIVFSFGSILGPIIGGGLLETIPHFNVLWIFIVLLLILSIVLAKGIQKEL